MINFKYDLDKSFQEFLYRIDNSINEGSGRTIKVVKAEYMNVSVDSPLSGSTYIELSSKLRNSMKDLLSSKLRNSMKDLIDIKNEDNKCFPSYLIRHLNPLKIHLERIKKADKNMVNDLGYEDIKFSASKKDFGKIENKNNVCINTFCYENNLVYLVLILDEKFKNCMDLLLIRDGNRLHYVYI